MQIDVSDKNIEKITEIANLLARSFPDHDIAVKQRNGRITIKVNQKKPAEVAPAPLAV